jgi:hypothetical protein
VPLDLTALLTQTAQVVAAARAELNRLDTVNGNHGDHLLAIFQEAATFTPTGDLATDLGAAAARLQALPDNGAAQDYAAGLTALAESFGRAGLQLADLEPHARALLVNDPEAPAPPRQSEVLRAVASGFSAWGRAAPAAPNGSAAGLDLGGLLGLGMAYLQAKAQGGARVDILAEAAVSVSPLARVPHRAAGARLALRALLLAIAGG